MLPDEATLFQTNREGNQCDGENTHANILLQIMHTLPSGASHGWTHTDG